MLEELVEEHMTAYRREKEQELLASAITPEEVERAMASPKYHALRLSFEAAAFRRQIEALRRLGGRTRAIMDEVEEKIEGLAEEPGAEEIEAQKEAVRQKYQGTDMWMKAPNGQPTKLTEEDWLLVRTPAFKAWFGDWEEVAKAIPRHNIQTLQEAKEILHRLGDKPLKNAATGIEASVSKRGRGKLISASARRLSEENGYQTADHLLAAANTEQLFEHAVLSQTKEDENGELLGIKLFSALVILHEKPAVACFTVKETSNAGHKIYTVQLLELKKPAGTLPRSAVKRSSASAGSSIISIAELANKYNTVEKSLDENGEPLLYGDKKAAVREFKKRISGSKEVLYCEGLSGHSRPSAETWASTLNAKLHLSGKFIIADEGEKSKGAKERGESKAKEEEASAKEPEGWRDLMRAIHRLRAAHRWGAEELSAIDALAKAANKMDLKDAWAKVKELLTKAQVNEQELKEAARGRSQLYRDLARKELSAMPLSEAMAVLTYRRQEREAARRVEKLVKSEKWEEAEREKEKQIMAAAMAREAGKITMSRSVLDTYQPTVKESTEADAATHSEIDKKDPFPAMLFTAQEAFLSGTGEAIDFRESVTGL